MSLSNGTPNFAEVQQQRLAAQMAFLKADSDARLPRAMNQNYRQNRYAVVVGQRMLLLASAGNWQAAEQVGRPSSVCRWRAMMCSPQQVRPATEDIDKEIPIGAKAALKDLRARSMRQFQGMFELGAGEVVLEDLMGS